MDVLEKCFGYRPRSIFARVLRRSMFVDFRNSQSIFLLLRTLVVCSGSDPSSYYQSFIRKSVRWLPCITGGRIRSLGRKSSTKTPNVDITEKATEWMI